MYGLNKKKARLLAFHSKIMKEDSRRGLAREFRERREGFSLK